MGQLVLARLQVLVFDPTNEEVTRWVPEAPIAM